MKRGGLGRGLAALIPGAEGSVRSEPAVGLVELSVDEIRPNRRQPRKSFPEESLAALAASIEQVGLLQPVVARRTRFGYELVAGERRLRAARLAGLTTVPAMVRQGDGDEAAALREALIENIHREELGPLELAAAFQELLDELGGTQEEVAARLGCSRAHVANTIRLLSLPTSVQRLVADRRIQAGHARALLGVANDQARAALALRAAAEGLSVRAVEDLVKGYAGATRVRRRSDRPRDPAVAAIEDHLMEALGTRVRVSLGGRGGRIVIQVASATELERVSSLVTARAESADMVTVPDGAPSGVPA